MTYTQPTGRSPGAATLAVLVNMNEHELTRRSIRSLLAQRQTRCDVLVVDNGSRIDPSEDFRREFEGLRVMRLPVNRGVAAGRNIGLQSALDNGYEFALLFDNDAHAAPDMLARLERAAERQCRAGILGPKIYRDDRPDTIWRAGCTSWKWTYLHTGPEILDRTWSLFGCRPRSFLDTSRGFDQQDRGQFDREEDVDFQIGCAQLIRCSVLREVGLLDQEFVPYGSEDIEFCARVRRGGWRIRYVPTAHCWHRVGSSVRGDYHRTFCNARNLLLLARKTLPPVYFWGLFLPDYMLLTVPLKIVDSVVRRAPSRRRALFDALAWNLADARQRGVLLRDRDTR